MDIMKLIYDVALDSAFAACVIWFLYHVITKTIPEDRKIFVEALVRLETRFAKCIDAICERLEKLDEGLQDNRKEINELRKDMYRADDR